mgnify:CR=1 FL=1
MPTYKLPVWDIVKETYSFVWNARRDFVLIATAPVLILTIFVTVMTEFFGASSNFGIIEALDTEETSNVGFHVDALNIGIPYVTYVMFSVAWHRRYLVPNERTTVWNALRWEMRKTRFLVRLLIALVLGATVVISLLVMTIPSVTIFVLLAGTLSGGWDSSFVRSVEGDELIGTIVVFSFLMLFLVLLFPVCARLFMWLPAAAVDDPAGLRELWRTGRRNTWRFFWILLVAAVPIWIFWTGWLFLPSEIDRMGLTVILLGHFVMEIFDFIAIAIGVSALSICYKRLKDAGTPVPADRPEAPADPV